MVGDPTDPAFSSQIKNSGTIVFNVNEIEDLMTYARLYKEFRVKSVTLHFIPTIFNQPGSDTLVNFDTTPRTVISPYAPKGFTYVVWDPYTPWTDWGTDIKQFLRCKRYIKKKMSQRIRMRITPVLNDMLTQETRNGVVSYAPVVNNTATVSVNGPKRLIRAPWITFQSCITRADPSPTFVFPQMGAVKYMFDRNSTSSPFTGIYNWQKQLYNIEKTYIVEFKGRASNTVINPSRTRLDAEFQDLDDLDNYVSHLDPDTLPAPDSPSLWEIPDTIHGQQFMPDVPN